ncbi:phage tail tip protein J-related protein [Aeromonas salmonicida]|uniref:phage tail tip protein J-related protein n=1 Tax=Aeromonas salmonicida TaxID=645 RepID=UPI0030CD869D
MPPVIVPVLVGVAAGAAAFTAGAVLTMAYAIGAMASMATMMLTTKTPSFSDFRGASERSQVLRAASSSKVAVYGRVISSGLLSNAKEQVGDQTDGELIYLALTIAGHKINGLGKIWLGDDLIETFGELASYELHNDRQTCDPYMLANCPNWREDMIGQGIAWVRFTFKFDAEKFPSGLPNIKMEKFGAEVWDPRDNKVKLTDNAALVILDYYRRWLKVPDDELRINEFIIAANICDEMITLKDGTQEKRYAINGEFDLSEAPAKILEDMHMSCAGQPTYVSGMHGIVVGAYYGPASEDLFDHQLQGDIDLLPEPPASDRINTVVGTFIDGETFQKMDFPAVKVAQWVEEDDGQELTEDLDFRFVTSPWQAQRLANILLRQRRTCRTITCSVNLSGWQYRPGSYLRLYIPALEVNGVEFRVVDWSFDLMDGVQLTLREESVDVWADAIGWPMERPDITDLPAGGIATPDQLRYEVETVGEIIQGVLSWHNVGTVAYNQVIIQRLEQGQPPEVVMTAQCPGQSCRVNGLEMGNYVALVRAVAFTGGTSPVSAVNFVIAAPPIPQSVKVTAANWSLAFVPQFSGGLTHGTICEWYWSKTRLPLEEVLTKATLAGQATHMTLSGLMPDTEYFVWLRSVNAYGKSGLLAVIGKTTYDVESILDMLDSQIGAEHLREELRTPIEAIPDLQDGMNHLATVTDGLTRVMDGVKASYEASAEAALEAATAGALGDLDRRRAVGQITREQKVQADNLGAMARQTEIISAELGKTTSMVQTTGEAVTKLDGEVRASWYTKAQVNGAGGGFGLEVKLNPDGTSLSTFLVDADVFAILSRATGETSKRNPFIVKNNNVYMNHVMLDTAEAGAVIAKYINVQHLVGTLIEGADIRGGTVYGMTITGSTINAGTINGGQINIANRFTVDGNGNVVVRSSPNGVGMSLDNNRIDIRDENNRLRVRIGLL